MPPLERQSGGGQVSRPLLGVHPQGDGNQDLTNETCHLDDEVDGRGDHHLHKTHNRTDVAVVTGFVEPHYHPSGWSDPEVRSYSETAALR